MKDEGKIDIKQVLLDVATSALKDSSISATSQVENLINYAASDKAFASVISSQDIRVINELKTQFKFVNEMGLDISKGRKLVYIKTRGLNIAPEKQPKVWVHMPDIQISYHALILILVRSESINSINVYHTYEKYPISFSGDPSDVPVVKSWEVNPKERGEYTGCFVVIKNKENEVSTSYHHYSDIIATHQKFSKSSYTWKDHTQAMTAKSAIMEAIRYIPMLDKSVQMVVEDYDNNQDYSKTETINKKQIKELSNLAETTETNLEELFDYLKKDKWEDVTTLQYKDAINFMSVKKEDIVDEQNNK